MCFLFSKPFWRIILKTATYLILQKPGFSNENLVILKNPKKRGFRKLRVYMQYTFDFDVDIMLYGLKAPFRTTF